MGAAAAIFGFFLGILAILSGFYLLWIASKFLLKLLKSSWDAARKDNK